MAYCTVADVRAEGVDMSIPDLRVTATIAQVTAYVDAMTGQWFESRPRVFLLDCAGGTVLPLPLAPITITAVTVDGSVWDPSTYVVDGDPGNPRLVASRGNYWPHGQGIVLVDGTWGVLEGGQTPVMIQATALKLVVRDLPLASDIDGQEAKRRGRIYQESLNGFSFSVARLYSAGQFTGDHDIDIVLTRYARPLRSGVT